MLLLVVHTRTHTHTHVHVHMYIYIISLLQDQMGIPISTNQAARAGLYTHLAMKMKSEIENETLTPVRLYLIN